MKIKVEKVRTWVPQGSRNGPQGSRNGPQNHLKIDEKTHLATASAAKPDFGVPGSVWGYPPCRKRLQKHIKKVFRSIKIRKQISVTKYSEKHLPLQNPLERGGLGGAHLDYIYIYIPFICSVYSL